MAPPNSVVYLNVIGVLTKQLTEEQRLAAARELDQLAGGEDTPETRRYRKLARELTEGQL
jgi:hypothetical protein